MIYARGDAVTWCHITDTQTYRDLQKWTDTEQKGGKGDESFDSLIDVNTGNMPALAVSTVFGIMRNFLFLAQGGWGGGGEWDVHLMDKWRQSHSCLPSMCWAAAHTGRRSVTSWRWSPEWWSRMWTPASHFESCCAGVTHTALQPESCSRQAAACWCVVCGLAIASEGESDCDFCWCYIAWKIHTGLTCSVKEVQSRASCSSASMAICRKMKFSVHAEYRCQSWNLVCMLRVHVKIELYIHVEFVEIW